jgi:hypothetical protein
MSFDRALLQQALKISQEMTAEAERGDWERVTRLDQQRLALLKECLDQGTMETERPFALEVLRQIQALQNALTDQATDRRREIEQALRLLHRRQEASAAYQETIDAG